jgi:hypothetical protein
MLDSVTITSEDFAAGRYLSVHDCPLAKALKRNYPEERVLVGGRDFDINNKTILISDKVAECIMRRSGRANQEPLVVEYDASELKTVFDSVTI